MHSAVFQECDHEGGLLKIQGAIGVWSFFLLLSFFPDFDDLRFAMAWRCVCLCDVKELPLSMVVPYSRTVVKV